MSAVESEPVFERMAAEAADARSKLLATIDSDPDRWWDARELREAAGASGAMAMFALCRLCNPEYDDTLELGSDLRIRRRRLAALREGDRP